MKNAHGCVLSFAPAADRTSRHYQPCGCAAFFRNIGDLLDVFERGEVRTDLMKELDRQQRKLQSRAEVHGVDQDRINELRQQLKQSGSTLMSAPRIGQYLREDRLIAPGTPTPEYPGRLL